LTVEDRAAQWYEASKHATSTFETNWGWGKTRDGVRMGTTEVKPEQGKFG